MGALLPFESSDRNTVIFTRNTVRIYVEYGGCRVATFSLSRMSIHQTRFIPSIIRFKRFNEWNDNAIITGPMTHNSFWLSQQSLR